MSLIDEALKRARQEAARQDAAQRYAYPATPAQVPARDRSRRALLTGLAAGLVIGALAIGGTLLVTRSRSGEEVAASPSPAAETAAPLPVSIEELSPATGSSPAAPAATPSPPAELPALASPTPAPVPTPAPPARVEVPAIEVQPRPAAPAPPPAPTPAAPQAAPPASSEPPPAIAAPAPPPLVVPAPDPEAPGAAPGPTHTAPPAMPPAEPGLDGRTFLRELPVPGGGRLELRGIASGSQPAALINGRVVGQGEVIEGFTVVAVEARRVQLRGYGATVYLSLDPEQ